MTLSTLTMAAVSLLAAVSVLSSSLLGVLVLFALRRMRPVEDLQADLVKLSGDVSTVRRDLRALDELLETFRKRDANRASQTVQRAKKEASMEAPIFDAEAFRANPPIA
jgi:hypothetical protein